MLLFSYCQLGSAKEEKSAQDRLIFAIDLIRHGDRNPIDPIPSAPYQWKEGLGELTPLGMRQEYELGRKYRHFYVHEKKLLSPSYQAGTLYVRSTDVPRTLMSAESFLLGLYPLGSGPTIGHFPFLGAALPGRFQPIPIHTVPKSEDSLLSPKIDQVIKENVLSSSAWKENIKRVQPHFAAWSRALGVPMESIEQRGACGDTLFIHILKKIPLPPLLSRREAMEIITTEKRAFALMFEDPNVGRAAGGPLLHQIADDLKQAALAATNSNQHSKVSSLPTLRYVLYSAHDGNILALMSAMHVPLKSPPPYASHLHFSLYLRADHSAYLRILYNDAPVLLSSSDSQGYSSLEAFLKMADFQGNKN